MCNKIHKEHEVIKEEGFGWKLFTIRKGKLYPLCKIGHFTTPTKEWVVWNKKHVDTHPDDDGFCFFLDKDEAQVALRSWGCGSLRKIAYRKGICEQIEHHFIAGNAFKIALCKEFKIIKKGEK